jgi:hypothetical protein
VLDDIKECPQAGRLARFRALARAHSRPLFDRFSRPQVNPCCASKLFARASPRGDSAWINGARQPPGSSLIASITRPKPLHRKGEQPRSPNWSVAPDSSEAPSSSVAILSSSPHARAPLRARPASSVPRYSARCSLASRCGYSAAQPSRTRRPARRAHGRSGNGRCPKLSRATGMMADDDNLGESAEERCALVKLNPPAARGMRPQRRTPGAGAAQRRNVAEQHQPWRGNPCLDLGHDQPRG